MPEAIIACIFFQLWNTYSLSNRSRKVMNFEHIYQYFPVYQNDACYRGNWFDNEGLLDKLGFDNCTNQRWLDDVQLFCLSVNVLYLVVYAVFIFIGLAVIIPISLVIYVYSNWPLAIIYNLIFTCIQTLGFLKHVNRWDVFMLGVCKMWRVISRIWHGYETKGMENIPKDGPVIFVFYHGTISMDIYYFVKAVNLDKGKLCRAVFHKQLTKMPGFPVMVKIARGLIGTRENCLEALKNGNHIIIAPGGDMEPLHSDETNYKLVWKSRNGFAKIAIQAQVPLVPVFTENIQELFRTPKFLRSLFLIINEFLHVPLVPAYGGFPVKLISHVGKPIYPEPHLSAVELAKKTHDALQQLIYENQRIPGSICAAISQRFQ